MSSYSDEASGVGWLIFAGSILGLAGIMRIFDAIWAFRYDGALPEQLEGAVFGTSLTTYGWVYLIVGLVLILASFAVFAGSQFARWIGMIAGGIGAISAFAWLPYYPVWSLIYILLAVLVVYALARYGGREPELL
jgi:hypothetical protein